MSCTEHTFETDSRQIISGVCPDIPSGLNILFSGEKNDSITSYDSARNALWFSTDEHDDRNTALAHTSTILNDQDRDLDKHESGRIDKSFEQGSLSSNGTSLTKRNYVDLFSGSCIAETILNDKWVRHHNKNSKRRRPNEHQNSLTVQKSLSSRIESGQASGCHSIHDYLGVASSHDCPIYIIGTDTMAKCLSYMEPQETHNILTMPLSKTWLSTYTQPNDLWKVLCMSNPFDARLEANDKNYAQYETQRGIGRFRMLYASFTRCKVYLDNLYYDAINGRRTSPIVGRPPSLGFTYINESLKAFFMRAKVHSDKTKFQVDSDVSTSSSSITFNQELKHCRYGSPILCLAKNDECPSKEKPYNEVTSKNSHLQLTHSSLAASRSPAVDDHSGFVNLPWTCAIYSVANWMVAFADVRGIQIICMKVLPYLLENEEQRTTAQRIGFTDIVLRAMVYFPDSVELHTAAFHTLVLLARPLGGREGMLFHSTMLNSSSIFSVGSSCGKNGIAVMLDSMQRFCSNEFLQAMSCWSMVNIALVPPQKSMLVKLGGISAAANAMLQHPLSAEVQFRSLFALINLVVPCRTSTISGSSSDSSFNLDSLDGESDLLDDSIEQVSNLVVIAMKNFCSSESILNRACLVLHNLSLNEKYHSTLIWIPNLYQMLEWAIGNFPNDPVLQQSAHGTLERLNTTLSYNDEMRTTFFSQLKHQRLNTSVELNIERNTRRGLDNNE